jgi:hypothetical protein
MTTVLSDMFHLHQAEVRVSILSTDHIQVENTNTDKILCVSTNDVVGVKVDKSVDDILLLQLYTYALQSNCTCSNSRVRHHICLTVVASKTENASEIAEKWYAVELSCLYQLNDREFNLKCPKKVILYQEFNLCGR